MNPQIFHADTFTLTGGGFQNTPQNRTIRLPIQPGQLVFNDNTVEVMEILKVFYSGQNNVTSGSAASRVRLVFSIFTGTQTAGSEQLESGWGLGNVIAHGNKFHIRLNDVAQAGTGEIDYSWVIDLTDGAGHGFVVGSSTLTHSFEWEAGGGLAGPTINSCNNSFALLWRVKRVSLTEWVGIVNSQQGSVTA